MLTDIKLRNNMGAAECKCVTIIRTAKGIPLSSVSSYLPLTRRDEVLSYCDECMGNAPCHHDELLEASDVLMPSALVPVSFRITDHALVCANRCQAHPIPNPRHFARHTAERGVERG